MVRDLGDTGSVGARFLGMTTSSANRVARPKEMAELDGTSNLHLPLRPYNSYHNVSTTMIYIHVLNKPGISVKSPLVV